jgi:hypothetical protein
MGQLAARRTLDTDGPGSNPGGPARLNTGLRTRSRSVLAPANAGRSVDVARRGRWQSSNPGGPARLNTGLRTRSRSVLAPANAGRSVDVARRGRWQSSNPGGPARLNTGLRTRSRSVLAPANAGRSVDVARRGRWQSSNPGGPARSFAPVGRRASMRCWCLRACRFKSGSVYSRSAIRCAARQCRLAQMVRAPT